MKWVGGKGRLLTELRARLPADVSERRHVEPFLGGGALFFGQAPRRSLISDVNTHLVATYIVVRDEPAEVIRILGALAARHSLAHFYEARARYNEELVSNAEHAALFIYLNKTCFNGLHRVNRRGAFNVPAGRYTNPRILDADALWAASDLLERATLAAAPFEETLARVDEDDFVYLDPPYVPVSATSNFTGYSEAGFGDADQVRLRDAFVAADRTGAKVMLSNSDAPRVHDLYAGYVIDRVSVGRSINSKASARGSVTEVIVRNYGGDR